MDRRVEGTFRSKNDIKAEIKRLINEEGYKPEELLLLSDDTEGNRDETSDVDNVQVDVVDADDEGSFWEKTKEALSFGNYQSEEADNVLEQYGVTQELSDHYLEALQEGEIVLLANADAPANPELSEVNQSITFEKENESMVDKKKDATVDEVNTEEENEIKKNNNKDEKPTDVSTSEVKDDNLDESTEPGQVTDTRSDEADNPNKNGSNDEKNESDTSTEDDGTDPDTTPELSGEEETVDSEETDHKESSNIAKGQVKPEPKDPSTDTQDNKDTE